MVDDYTFTDVWFVAFMDIIYRPKQCWFLNANVHNMSMRLLALCGMHICGAWQWQCHSFLTHWGRVTHIRVSKLNIIGSDNGLSPGQRQAIIWTNVGILLIGPIQTNFSEILSEIHTFSFKKMHFKTSSAKPRPSCLGLNVLIECLARLI